MRIGIFGGTFDPAHNGHLILASEALKQLKLERLLWVLTPEPPHKGGQVVLPLQDRLELLKAALAGNPAFELSRVDIDRPGPHYALDTLRILGELYPQDELFYLIGGDSLRDLPFWYHPDELLQLCNGLGVMRRPGGEVDLQTLESKLPGIEKKLFFVEAPLLEISSSDIRSRIAAEQHFRYYLPEGVYSLILERGYYQD